LARIGIFTDSLYYPIFGGVNRVTQQLLKHIAANDKKNHYVLFNTSGVTDTESAGISQSNFETVAIPGSRKYLYGLWCTVNRPKVEKWTGPLDVMLTPFHFVPPSRAPFVITIHDVFILQEPELFTLKLRLTNKVAFKRAPAAASIVVVSKTTRELVVKHLGIPDSRISTVYSGITEDFQPQPSAPSEADEIKSKYGINGDYFLNLGVIQPRKNQHRLVSAYELFRKCNPANEERLVLAGQKGWLTGEFDELLNKSPFRKDIIITGFIPDEDIPPLMRAAKAFVFPTLLEGFGLPVLEAMACGVPLIVSELPVLHEIAGDLPVFINPLQIESIESGLEKVCSDNFDDRITKGIERSKRFNWNTTAERYIEMFERIAGEEK